MQKAPFLAKPEANGRHLANSGFPPIFLPLTAENEQPPFRRPMVTGWRCTIATGVCGAENGWWKLTPTMFQCRAGRLEKAVNPVGCVKTNG
jgi:hypothetical protein